MRPIAVALLFCVSALQSSAAAAPESSGPAEQALRQRVEKFYSLLQEANWKRAESFIAEESKETYSDQQKNPFFGYRIVSVKIEPDGETGTSVVELFVVAASVPGPMAVRKTLRWRWEDGNWHAVLVRPDPQAFNKLFLARQGQAVTGAPPPEELKFKEHRYDFGIIHPDQKKVAVFPFTNATEHTVTIAEIITDCECLKPHLEKREYKSGEAGELAIEFDPAGLKFAYVQTVMVKTQPGDRVSYLTVSAYIRSRLPHSGAAETKP